VPKAFTDHESNPCAKLTRYVEVTIQELYDKVMHDVKQLHRKASDEETCAICMCNLYDDVETMPAAKRAEINARQMKGKEPISVVIMSKCTDHCFHKECLENQLDGKDNLRCAVCS
jgi:hypothetical protein